MVSRFRRVPNKCGRIFGIYSKKEIDELISIELNMKNRVRKKKKKTKLLGVKTFKMLSRRYHSKIVHLLSNLFYFFAENISHK